MQMFYLMSHINMHMLTDFEHKISKYNAMFTFLCCKSPFFICLNARFTAQTYVLTICQEASVVLPVVSSYVTYCMSACPRPLHGQVSCDAARFIRCNTRH